MLLTKFSVLGIAPKYQVFMDRNGTLHVSTKNSLKVENPNKNLVLMREIFSGTSYEEMKRKDWRGKEWKNQSLIMKEQKD